MIQTIVFSLGVIAVMAAMIILIVISGNIARRKKMKEIDDLYDHLASQHSLSYTHRDVFGDKLLALDEARKILVYINNSEELKHRVIHLQDLSKTQIVESGVSYIETKNNGTTVAEDHSRDFSLALIRGNGAVIDLPIYTEMQEGIAQRGKLMNLARDWKRKLNSLTDRTVLQFG